MNVYGQLRAAQAEIFNATTVLEENNPVKGRFWYREDLQTFRFSKDGTPMDLEEQGNKEDTTLNTSSTKYPTNRLVKEYVDSFVDQSVKQAASPTFADVLITGLSTNLYGANTSITAQLYALDRLIRKQGDSGFAEDQAALIRPYISYNPTTRVLSVHTNNVPVTFYNKGKEITKTIASGTPETTTAHADETGNYYFYYDNSGVLQVHDKNVFFELSTDTTVWGIYYNSTLVDALETQEVHGLMDWRVHLSEHINKGAYKLGAGGIISDVTPTDGAGNTASLADVRASISGVLIRDEDIPHTLDTFSGSGVGSIYTVLSRTGSLGYWTWSNYTTPFGHNGTNPYYNQLSGGSYVLTPITGNGEYFNMYVFARGAKNSTDSKRFIWLMGQKVHATIALARNESLASNDLSGFPTAEFVPLAKCTMRRKNGNSATTFQTNFAEITYLTGNSLAQINSTAPSIHNNLSGRSDAGGHPIGAIYGAAAYCIPFQNAGNTALTEDLNFTYNGTVLSAPEVEATTMAALSTFLGTEITTPANPIAGTRKLYAKNDGWYELDSTGAEKKVGAGGGAGDADTLYLLRGADLVIGDIDLSGNNSAFDGGGSLVGDLSLNTTASNQILGTQAIYYTSDGGSGQNDYFGFTKAIPIGLRGRDIGFDFLYKTQGAYADNDFRFCIKQKDGTLANTITYHSILAATLTNNIASRFTVAEFIASDCTEIEFGWQNTDTSSGIVFIVDNICINAKPYQYVNQVDFSEVIYTGITTGTSNTEIKFKTELSKKGSLLSVDNTTYTKITCNKDNTLVSASVTTTAGSVSAYHELYIYNSSNTLVQTIQSNIVATDYNNSCFNGLMHAGWYMYAKNTGGGSVYDTASCRINVTATATSEFVQTPAKVGSQIARYHGFTSRDGSNYVKFKTLAFNYNDQGNNIQDVFSIDNTNYTKYTALTACYFDLTVVARVASEFGIYIYHFNSANTEIEKVQFVGNSNQAHTSSPQFKMNAGDYVIVQSSDGNLNDTTYDCVFICRATKIGATFLASLPVNPVVAIYESNAGQSIAHNTVTILDMEDKLVDTHGAVTVGANWVFTAPYSMYYDVLYSGLNGASTNYYQEIYSYISGTKDKVHDYTSSADVMLKACFTVYLAKGATLNLRQGQYSGSAKTMNTGDYRPRICIKSNGIINGV